MKTKLLSVISAAVLFGTCGFAFAENRTVNKAPGHEMQQKGSFKNDPGASGYAPGQEMQRKGSKPGDPGASGYTPGH